MTERIKFGTSGWRAIISDEFTYYSVRFIAAQSSNERLHNTLRLFQIIHFTRLGPHEFERGEGSLSSQGVSADVRSQLVTTFKNALTIIGQSLVDAIKIADNDDSSGYSCIKFPRLDGARALPDVIGRIEVKIARLRYAPWKFINNASNRTLKAPAANGPADFSYVPTKITFELLNVLVEVLTDSSAKWFR